MITLIPIQIAIEYYQRKQSYKDQKKESKKERKYSKIQSWDLANQIETIKM